MPIGLMERTNRAPSIHHDWGTGLHHIKPGSHDCEADVAVMLSAGYGRQFWREIPGLARFIYFDAIDRCGHSIEISELVRELVCCQVEQYQAMQAICEA